MSRPVDVFLDVRGALLEGAVGRVRSVNDAGGATSRKAILETCFIYLAPVITDHDIIEFHHYKNITFH